MQNIGGNVMEFNKIEIGQRIRKFIEDANLTFKGVSKLTGLHQTSISNCVLGKYELNLNGLDKIAQTLNISPNMLLGYKNKSFVRDNTKKVDKSNLSEIFSKKLKYLLSKHSLSYAELSELSGLGNGTVSRWINGQSLPSVSKLYKICNVFDVDPNYFMGYGRSTGVTISESMINSPLHKIAMEEFKQEEKIIKEVIQKRSSQDMDSKENRLENTKFETQKINPKNEVMQENKKQNFSASIQNISVRLNLLMDMKELESKDLSKETKIKADKIEEWLLGSGQMDVGELCLLAQALGVSPNNLLGWK